MTPSSLLGDLAFRSPHSSSSSVSFAGCAVDIGVLLGVSCLWSSSGWSQLDSWHCTSGLCWQAPHVSPAGTTALNSRLGQPAAYWTSPWGCPIGVSCWTAMGLHFVLFLPTPLGLLPCFFPHFGKWDSALFFRGKTLDLILTSLFSHLLPVWTGVFKLCRWIWCAVLFEKQGLAGNLARQWRCVGGTVLAKSSWCSLAWGDYGLMVLQVLKLLGNGEWVFWDKLATHTSWLY